MCVPLGLELGEVVLRGELWYYYNKMGFILAAKKNLKFPLAF